MCFSKLPKSFLGTENFCFLKILDVINGWLSFSCKLIITQLTFVNLIINLNTSVFLTLVSYLMDIIVHIQSVFWGPKIFVGILRYASLILKLLFPPFDTT